MKGALQSIVLASALFGAPAWAEPVEIRFASPAPPQSPVNTQGISAWIKDVTGASEGTLSIRLMPGPTLATFENVYDRVLKGVADIGFGTSNTIGGQFRKTEVATLPFETENPGETALALWRLLQRGVIADEYAQAKTLGLFSFPHNLIHTRSVRVKSLADMKGLKLRAGGKLDGDVIAALGAAPITLAPPEIYTSISNGLVEGAMVAWTAVDSFKLYEVAKNHFAAPLSSATAFILMNRRSYEKLPPQAKAAIERYSGERFSRRMSAVVQAMDDSAKNKVRSMSDQRFESISAEEQARWKTRLDKITTDWVQSTPNGSAVLTAFRDEIKKIRSGQ